MYIPRYPHSTIPVLISLPRSLPPSGFHCLLLEGIPLAFLAVWYSVKDHKIFQYLRIYIRLQLAFIFESYFCWVQKRKLIIFFFSILKDMIPWSSHLHCLMRNLIFPFILLYTVSAFSLATSKIFFVITGFQQSSQDVPCWDPFMFHVLEAQHSWISIFMVFIKCVQLSAIIFFNFFLSPPLPFQDSTQTLGLWELSMTL